MSNQETFIDPLEEMMGRLSAEPAQPATPESEDTTSQIVSTPVDDDEYGKNDLAKEIASEEAAIDAAMEQRRAEMEAAKNQTPSTVMPPISIDKEYQAAAIGFQANKLAIVGRMIDRVVAENNLPPGGIPVSTDEDKDLQRHIMGELIACYEDTGEEITDRFRDLIVSNWKPAQPVAPEAAEEPDEEQREIESPKEEPIPQININVEGGTPVTVNVDSDVVASMSSAKRVDVIVTEVTHEELKASRVITNSQDPNIIQPYQAEQFDVPLTLALSGYRCMLRPVNYHEFIQLGSSTSSGSPVDQEIKQWSILYDHIKNVSIGEFEDFDDFLKKTKYSDRELLMWGILISAADDEETISIQCGNKKCQAHHTIKYRPRSIIHVNDELMKKYESEITHTVAPGEDALKHFKKINSTLKRYTLPHSKYIVEIEDRPSAYDFITRRYPLMDQLEKRFYPNGHVTDPDSPDYTPEDPEYSYLLAHALFITAISIIKKDENGEDIEYRFTTWEDIEKIITKSLDMQDEAILMQLVGQIAGTTANPVQFYIEDFTCSVCGRHEKRVAVRDIGDTLIFQLSQRLSSTQIKLIETEST